MSDSVTCQLCHLLYFESGEAKMYHEQGRCIRTNGFGINDLTREEATIMALCYIVTVGLIGGFPVEEHMVNVRDLIRQMGAAKATELNKKLRKLLDDMQALPN